MECQRLQWEHLQQLDNAMVDLREAAAEYSDLVGNSTDIADVLDTTQMAIEKQQERYHLVLRS